MDYANQLISIMFIKYTSFLVEYMRFFFIFFEDTPILVKNAPKLKIVPNFQLKNKKPKFLNFTNMIISSFVQKLYKSRIHG